MRRRDYPGGRRGQKNCSKAEKADRSMKKKFSPVTFHYTLITGGFWMAFCVVTAYAAVYLQGIGCNNQELGLILAMGNVGGAVLSPPSAR